MAPGSVWLAWIPTVETGETLFGLLGDMKGVRTGLMTAGDSVNEDDTDPSSPAGRRYFVMAGIRHDAVVASAPAMRSVR